MNRTVGRCGPLDPKRGRTFARRARRLVQTVLLASLVVVMVPVTAAGQDMGGMDMGCMDMGGGMPMPEPISSRCTLRRTSISTAAFR